VTKIDSGPAERVLVNGIETRSIDTADRGLQYGHGVFETCRVVAGRIPLWRYHRARLEDAAHRLDIALDLPGIEADVERLTANAAAALIKIVVTAGSSGRGYAAMGGHSNRVVSRFASPARRSDADGVTVRLCATRLSIQPALAGLKHLNRLEQVLARSEWRDTATADGLMCDVEGRLIEGTATNLFLAYDDRLVTASLQRCGVAGVMRRVLLEERPGIDVPIEVRDVSVDELRRIDGCFLTNAVIGVWDVAHVNGIGDMPRRAARIVAAIRAALEAQLGFTVSH
jgi:4-amino-4-deoxychorismate lyase